jgi:hypothetical protein
VNVIRNYSKITLLGSNDTWTFGSNCKSLSVSVEIISLLSYHVVEPLLWYYKLQLSLSGFSCSSGYTKRRSGNNSHLLLLKLLLKIGVTLHTFLWRHSSHNFGSIFSSLLTIKYLYFTCEPLKYYFSNVANRVGTNVWITSLNIVPSGSYKSVKYPQSRHHRIQGSYCKFHF